MSVNASVGHISYLHVRVNEDYVCALEKTAHFHRGMCMVYVGAYILGIDKRMMKRSSASYPQEVPLRSRYILFSYSAFIPTFEQPAPK